MIIGANTGPQLNSDGVQNATLRSDRLGALAVVELRGRYAENTRRGLRMHGANQAAVTTSAGLSTTYTGLVLANPPGSTVNLEIDKVGFAILVAFAAASAIGIMCGYSAAALSAVTADGQYSALVGTGSQGQGVIYKAATLPVAPTVRKVMASGLTGAITTAVEIPGDMIDLEGSIILPPGGFAAFYTSTASGASGFLGSIEWTEVVP